MMRVLKEGPYTWLIGTAILLLGIFGASRFVAGQDSTRLTNIECAVKEIKDTTIKDILIVIKENQEEFHEYTKTQELKNDKQAGINLELITVLTELKTEMRLRNGKTP